MTVTKRDMERIAQGFKYVADDPAANHSTVIKMLQEFSNAAESLNPRFDRAKFVGAVFGESHQVHNSWNYKQMIKCGACGWDFFYDRGRSLDTFNHECARCSHLNHTMTETGMSA